MAVLKNGEIVLYGFVGDSFWEEGFTASEVMEALAELGRDEDVTVRINSGGGYVYDGVAIFNALNAHRGNVTVHIDAIAASAASVIAMAGDTIIMRAGALMMIHDSSMFTWGNAEEHEKSKTVLDKLSDQMANIYAERSGGDAEDIRAEMKDETWMTGEEAVERGFATETEDTRARAVAAFDYRAYANAPDRLTTMAKKKNWTLDSAPSAAAGKPKKSTAKAKEPPKMGVEDKSGAGAGDSTSETEKGTATAADERARIKAITGAEEAKGCPGLAQHYAFETDASVEDAIAAMKAASGDAKPESNAGEAEQPDATSYQAQRTAAQGLSQPGGEKKSQAVATINTSEIYAQRRKTTGA